MRRALRRFVTSRTVDFDGFVDEHAHTLVPPVGNKLLFSDFLKVMIVAGPNQRKDYHLQVSLKP